MAKVCSNSMEMLTPTGVEVSPRLYADNKIYVGSMISHAVLQYMCATNDTVSLESSLGQVLAGVGHYMVSKLTHDPVYDQYKINSEYS